MEIANAESSQKPKRRSPLNRNRNNTDIIFIFLFLLIVIAWIGLIGYGGAIHNSKNKPKEEIDWMSIIIKYNDAVIDFTVKNYKLWQIATLLWFVISGAAMMILFILILKCAPKFCTYIGILIFFMIIVTFVYEIVKGFIDINYNIPQKAIISIILEKIVWNIIKLLYFVVLLTCMVQTGVNHVAEIIQKSYRATLHFYSLIMLTLIAALVHVTLIILVMTTLHFTKPGYLIHFFVILGCLYVVNFFISFTNMVVSATIATWHRTKNKNEIPNTTFVQCITIIGRYHLGSVAFSATFILPVILAIFFAIRHPFKVAKKVVCCPLEVICKISIIFSIKPFAEVLVANRGYNYLHATRKSLRLLIKNCSSSITVITILYFLIEVGTTIIFSVSFLLAYNFVHDPIMIEPKVQLSLPFEDSKTEIILFTITTLTAVLYVPIQTFALSTAHSTFLCNLEDDEDNNSTQKLTNTYKMQQRK